MLDQLFYIFVNHITPETILLTVTGVTLGIIVGAIPGLTATMAIAILVPFTYSMNMISALAMLIGVYTGGVYGGSISAVLLSIPGTPAAVMTSLDGHPMAERGEGGKAIGIATIASFVGGVIGCIFLSFCCSALSAVAMRFGYPEFFVLTIFALVIIANSSGKSLIKGLIASALGVLVSLVGMDGLTGYPRLTFGVSGLLGGISLIPCLIGLFGLSEVFDQILTLDPGKKEKQKMDRVFPGFRLIWKMKWTLLRSSLIGTFIGALPGTGGTVGSFTAYNFEKNHAKDPDSFGKGAPEGIAAAESANNAAIGGALVPMMALAVPGDGITAILMGAFLLHGIQVGPSLFTTSPDVVYSVYVFSFLANIAMVALGLLAAKLFAKVVDIDNRILLPVILMVCMIGSYSATNHTIQIFVMLFFGVMGYLLKKAGIPPSAMLLGIVLGRLSEVNFRSALAMSRGSYAVFFRPIPCVIWALALLMLLFPKISAYFSRRKRERSQAVGEDIGKERPQ